MNNQSLRNTVAELQDLYAQQEELKALVNEREAKIKEEMQSRELEVLDLGNVVIRFQEILSNRFDTKSFKKDFLDIYQLFTKQVVSKRFTIA